MWSEGISPFDDVITAEISWRRKLNALKILC